MIIPAFRIQIVSADSGVVASSYGGGQLERDLIAAVIEEFRKRPPGMFASKAKIEEAVTASIYAACMALKKRTAEVIAERFAAVPPKQESA